MRHISILGRSPNADWCTKANSLLVELTSAPDSEARNAIIDKNQAFWGELKQWLLELSHHKCWFSEAKEIFSYYHVEHFRPKKSAKDIDGTEHGGYWWLTFDWTNFRICGSVGNSKKGTFFPLHPASPRIGLNGDVRLEEHLLLDPVDPNDPALLSFNFEGNPIVAPGVTDEWDEERVVYSIKRLNLDFRPLVDRRKIVWTECWSRASTYNEELARYNADKTNAFAKAKFKEAAIQLRSMIKDDCELSTVARACLVSSGDKRLLGLLQSA